MNDILNRGFVSPYIEFQFAAGTIDTIPPKYFASFHQIRTAETACTFELELLYAPDVYSASDATMLHKMLLSSVNQDVTYRYGYIAGGSTIPIIQDQVYAGQFLEYDETLADGYMTYKIKGVSHQVDMAQTHVQIQDFLRQQRETYEKLQPSRVVHDLLFTSAGNSTGLPAMFANYTPIFDNTDDEIDKSSLTVPDGTVHDLLLGTYDANNTYLPGGFVRLSNRMYGISDMLDNGLITEREIQLADAYNHLESLGQHQAITYEMEMAYQEVQAVSSMPFVCYFDNVIDGMGSNKRGMFYYVEKQHRQVTDIFTYNFGNNFIDSDVLSFDVSYDCTAAFSSVPALKEIQGNIDVNGNFIGTNNNITQTGNFRKNSYNTLSGFNESMFISESVINKGFNFPIDATMTIIGQTKCNKLYDVIRVNVYVNGVEHKILTGDYTIFGIEDNLSDAGFTTTFKLTKLERSNKNVRNRPAVMTNKNDSDAAITQETINNNP